MILKRSFSLWLGVTVLIAVIGLTLWHQVAYTVAAHHLDLLDQLPVAPVGWVVKNMPIADTEEMKKAVGEMLNYDKAVFREYKKGDRSLTVYAAYWKPYKFNPRLISIHTPDICWVGNGWKMLEEEDAYPVELGSGKFTWPAQERLFETGGTAVNVLYWHVLDGRLSGYAEGRNSASRSFFQNFWHDLRYGSGEQFFIRLSSPQPWDSWKDDPLFKKILNTFAPVLAAEPEAGGARTEAGRGGAAR